MTARPDVTTVVTTPRTWGQRLFDDAKTAHDWLWGTINPRFVPADAPAQFGPIFWVDVQWALFTTGGET